MKELKDDVTTKEGEVPEKSYHPGTRMFTCHAEIVVSEAHDGMTISDLVEEYVVISCTGGMYAMQLDSHVDSKDAHLIRLPNGAYKFMNTPKSAVRSEIERLETIGNRYLEVARRVRRLIEQT